MDVPFISSGALSRAHYALVRKVEESTSESTVSRVLETEVKSIRLQLAQPSPLVGVIFWTSFGNVTEFEIRRGLKRHSLSFYIAP